MHFISITFDTHISYICIYELIIFVILNKTRDAGWDISRWLKLIAFVLSQGF